MTKSKKYHFETGKKQIKNDIKKGIVPNEIRSFSSLHNYVDANKYGGFLDENYTLSKDFIFENDVQSLIDLWLKKRYVKIAHKKQRSKAIKESVRIFIGVYGFDYCIADYDDWIECLTELIELDHCDWTEKDMMIYTIHKISGRSYGEIKEIFDGN